MAVMADHAILTHDRGKPLPGRAIQTPAQLGHLGIICPEPAKDRLTAVERSIGHQREQIAIGLGLETGAVELGQHVPERL
jgi:hypothetical protein